MKEIHQFIADDGTEFNNRHDCEVYEFRQKIETTLPIRGFDRLGKEMENITDENIADCYFMLIENEEQFRTLELINEFSGEYIPNDRGIGLYFWDNRDNEWYNFEDFSHFNFTALYRISKKLGLI